MSNEYSQQGEGIWRFRIEEIEEQYLNGDLYAVLSGVSLCRRFDKPLPDWLSDAVLETIGKILDGRIRGKRGAGNKVLGNTEKRSKNIVRRNAVLGIRAWQKNIHFYHLMPPRAIELWFSEDLEDFGKTLEAAFKIAQLCLAGTKAQGSPSQMEKAYRNRSIIDEFIPDWTTTVHLGFLDHPGPVLSKSRLKVPGHIREKLSSTKKPDLQDLLKLY